MEKGFSNLLSSMCSRYTVILQKLGKDLNEKTQFWRFINNPSLKPDKLMSHYWSESTVDFGDKDILVIGDSSTLTFDLHANRKGLGYVGPNTTKSGFDIHACIMVDAEHGGCYGVGNVDFYKKIERKTELEEAQKLERRKNRWKLPFEQKERYKWFTGPQKAIVNCAGAKRYTLVGDRESDIYDLIARTLEQKWHFLYRSRTNRSLTESAEQRTLYDFLEALPVKYTYDLALKATKKRSAHLASLDVKYGKTTIKRPHCNPDKGLADQCQLYVVEVKEHPETVVGEEKPIHWTLLTSHPVNGIKDALQIIKWYRWRWIIEQVFRTLKRQGLNIEASTVESYKALETLTTLATIAALQIMQLVQARDGHSLENMNQVFLKKEQECIRLLNPKLEGKTKKSKNPHPPDSLAFAVWVIARLGGWSGYAKQKPPGPIIITDGFTRFFNILEGYYLIL